MKEEFIDLKHKLPNPETYGRPWIDLVDRTIVDGKSVIIRTTYKVDRSINQKGYISEGEALCVKTEIRYKWLPVEQEIIKNDLKFKEGGIFGE